MGGRKMSVDENQIRLTSIYNMTYTPECLVRDLFPAPASAASLLTNTDLLRRRQKVASAHHITRTCSHERMIQEALREVEGR